MFKIKNILVIDDESTVRALLKEIIMDMNYGFFEAARAEKGLKILEKEEISLVFLDIQLPNTNGLDILPKIKDLYPNTPVYLISAFHNMESVIKNMNLKVEGFIPKPFDIYKINEIVESELEKGDK
ncbi:MAG: response regulator [Fusobacteriaceae bacterium]|jgi:two-component system response regulator (stage 0 sporulation protein F)|nr:response regulator [Fusobacteriaceae bacterium]MBP9596187.1 response regulator [Fusobacteriaceae bacterium]